MKQEQKHAEWVPKTELGRQVVAGRFDSLESVLKHGHVILESEIVDALVHDIEHEVIYIGGSPGKGGGIRRTATKRTARMHKSGRRYKLTAMIVAGNRNGLLGIGVSNSKEHRIAIEKALLHAKLNIIRVRRGCGNWECACGGLHSVPFKASGKAGSVTAILSPAPKGVGIVANQSVRQMLALAGIKDIWVYTSGQTQTRNNLVLAVFEALKNLNSTKGEL